jgi:L-2-hydroxyglutarate oxidase LhgO
LNGSFDFDSVVVSAGAVGLAIGRALAPRGQKVVLLKREAGPHLLTDDGRP